MRIGIDLACWANDRGYGRYTRNLLRALAARGGGRHAFVGLADATTAASSDFPTHLDVVSVRVSQAPALAAAADGRRRMLDVWRMSRAAQRARLEAMFFPSTYTYFPVLGRTRTVIVVHDATAEQLPGLIFPSSAGRMAWTLKTRLACWQAQRVVTVSRASARAICEHLPVAADRVRVIHEAPDPIFRIRDSEGDRARQHLVLKRYGIPITGRRVLYVGGFGPHKNVSTLVRAFAQLSDPGLHLVLVGKTEGEVFYSEIESLRAEVRNSGLQERVTFTGFVPDDDLVDLYASADCLVLPSQDEGFGLPVVEAMACGTPVIASRVGAVPELAGGDTALLVEPGQLADVFAALRRLLGDPVLAETMRTAGLRRAAELSWDRAADELLSVFDELEPDGRRVGEPRYA